MMKLKAISPCFYPTDSPAKYLVKSAESNGLPLRLFGVGDDWPGFIDGKILPTIRALHETDAEIVAFLDANDVIVQRPYDEILWAYNKLTANTRAIVLGADVSCYPRCLKGDFFRHPLAPPYLPKWPYRYPNSGVIIGGRENLIDAFTKIAIWHERSDLAHLYPKTRHVDQHWWQWMYLTGELDYMIDYYCKTSIQLNMIWKADRVGYANHAIFEDGAHCGGSPTPPAFAHFDGESKQRLMPFAAKRIGLEQSCPDALEDSDWLIVSPENYADAIKNRGR